MSSSQDAFDAFGIAIHLEKHICAHGLAMSNNGLLILSLSIPAVQLYTPAVKRAAVQYVHWHT